MFKLLCVFAFIAGCCGAPLDETETITKTSTRISAQMKYYVYNSVSHFHEGFEMVATRVSVRAAPLLRTRNTVVLIHGQNDNYLSIFSQYTKDLLLQDNLDVIIVDWALFSSTNYDVAALMVPQVGAAVAEMIGLVVSNARGTLAGTHIIGFGLGAHIAGIAGRTLGAVARVTGLDPSGGDAIAGTIRSLSSSDANYVEVIHTNGGVNGIGTAIGHADFFVNGGQAQPDCVSSETDDDGNVAEEVDDDCNHRRSWELFGLSLTTELVGYRCYSIAEVETGCSGLVGYPLGNNDYTKQGSGIYYLEYTRS